MLKDLEFVEKTWDGADRIVLVRTKDHIPLAVANLSDLRPWLRQRLSEADIVAYFRLMGSASELLAACEEALDVLKVAVEAGCDDPETARSALAGHTTLNRLRAAIARVKGEQPPA